MRLSILLLSVASFAGAGALSLIAAGLTATTIEESSVSAVRHAFDDAGLQWADADADGLQVFIIGTAPSEADRFKALSTAGKIVDAARVIDQMNVIDTEGLKAPRFALEMLRNDAGVSMIGLIPEASDEETFLGKLKEKYGEDTVTDLVDSAKYPSPKGWDEALAFSLTALDLLPRSKISMEANRVQITAMVDSAQSKRTMESRLYRDVPPNLDLTLTISAPRPVITPYLVRFLIDENGKAQFDACSAENETDTATILEAAHAAGLPEGGSCREGLGAPTRRWAEGISMAMIALRDIGGGALTVTDGDMTIEGIPGKDQATFDRIIGELEAKLPPVFSLSATLPKKQDVFTSEAEFVATLAEDGTVQMRGRINDELTKKTIGSFAQARFGVGKANMAARVDKELPASWSTRALAGIEALSYLKNGTMRMTSEMIDISGQTGDASASDKISALITEKLGESTKFSVNAEYLKKLDPVAALPSPEECEAQIASIIADHKINFEPSSAKLDAQAKSILDDIAEVLRSCGDIRLEIGGYTDSQGGEAMNKQLSQSRAEAVMAELRNRRISTSAYSAKGYGEDDPIATNDTEEGREANRRIEFKLIRSGGAAPKKPAPKEGN